MAMIEAVFMRLRSTDKSYAIGIQVSDLLVVIHFDGILERLTRCDLIPLEGDGPDLQELWSLLHDVMSNGSDYRSRSIVGEFSCLELPDDMVPELMESLKLLNPGHPRTTALGRNNDAVWTVINDVLVHHAAKVVIVEDDGLLGGLFGVDL